MESLRLTRGEHLRLARTLAIEAGKAKGHQRARLQAAAEKHRKLADEIRKGRRRPT